MSLHRFLLLSVVIVTPSGTFDHEEIEDLKVDHSYIRDWDGPMAETVLNRPASITRLTDCILSIRRYTF